jgi:hypothetical protein
MKFFQYLDKFVFFLLRKKPVNTNPTVEISTKILFPTSMTKFNEVNNINPHKITPLTASQITNLTNSTE